MIIADQRFRQWVEKRLGMTLDPDAQFIGRIVADKIVAVVAFTHYTGMDVDLSVAGENGSGTKGLLQAVFAYAFDQLDCSRCTARIRASNQQSAKLAERLGFVHEGTLRRGYGDEDALIFGLLREDYGKQFTKAAHRARSGNDSGSGKPVQPLQPVQPVWIEHLESGPEWA